MTGLIKYYTLLAVIVLPAGILHAQQDSSATATDTARAKALQEVTVSAYGSSTLLQTAAAISTISTADLNRYSNTSILPATNTQPGIRMEERSPGSYRFGIRGSALESPFGIRNVKIYYDDIPLTEPGGNSYLNGLGFSNYQSLEVIKGPGSSLYGAGTGGVVLINSLAQAWQPGASVTYTGGSYGLSSTMGTLHLGDSSFQNTLRYEHLSSDGYRQQSKMRKDVGAWDAVLKQHKGTELDAHFLYSDLYYQTPGALTEAEYNAEPKAARPATATAPGAVASNAAIYQKLLLAGFTARQHWNDHFQGAATLYGAYVQQVNPNIRNYSRVTEPYFGGRASGTYSGRWKQIDIQAIAGAEVQQGFTQNSVFNDSAGIPGAQQSQQSISNRLLTGFAQLSAATGGWMLTGGLSLNQLRIGIENLVPQPYSNTTLQFTQAAPRIALLRRLSHSISAFAAVEKGFSPPTTDELAPTGSAANLALQPETGWNYEAGIKGYLLQHRLYFDATAFYFRLTNAIVQRRDSSGGDYYLNAGGTRQSGVELLVSYTIIQTQRYKLSAWSSYTGFHFHYADFMQLESDYSGNRLPGIAPATVSAGATLDLRNGLYATVSYFFSGRLPLDDANDAYTNAYHLLGSRIGYKLPRKKYLLEVFAGGDNLLNQRYSLGNDINAAGGRYYNAAASINFFAGVSVGYLK